MTWDPSQLPPRPRWRMPLDFGEAPPTPPGPQPHARPLTDREVRRLVREPGPVLSLAERALLERRAGR